MKSKLFAGPLTPNKTSTRYIDICSPSVVAANEPIPPMPTAGTFRNLYVRLVSDPDTGASAKGYIFTLQKGGVDQALTVSVLSSTASFEAADTTHSVHYNAGDTVSLSVVPTNSVSPGNPLNTPTFSLVMEFEGDTANQSILIAGVTSNLGAVAGTLYTALVGCQTPGATENQMYTVAPCAGSITSFSVNLQTVPGAGDSRTFILRNNGANATGGTSIAFGAAVNGVQSATQTISVAQGDLLNVELDNVGTPAACLAGWSIVFEPTTDGNFIIPAAAPASQLATAANRFIPIGVTTYTVNSTEANAQQIASADFGLKSWTGWLDATPGGGAKKWTFTLRENATTLTGAVTISGDMTTQGPTTIAASSSPYSIPANYGWYDTMCVPTSTPTAARLTMSYLGYIAPAGGSITGTGGVTAQHAALAASGTYTSAAITGTSAVAAKKAVVAASGTYTPGAITGTSAVAARKAVLAASGTYTPQAITGTGAVAGKKAAIAATGTYSAPGAITGTATVAAKKAIVAASGTYTPGAITGTAAAAARKAVLAASGTYTPAAITGTAGVAGRKAVLAASGTFTPAGAITGTAAVAGRRAILAASGTFTPPPAPTVYRIALSGQFDASVGLRGEFDSQENLKGRF